MLNKFREDLENLIYKYAQYGIKLTDVSYDVTSFTSLGEKFYNPENLSFKIEVSSDE